jgi:hypothetical protein
MSATMLRVNNFSGFNAGTAVPQVFLSLLDGETEGFAFDATVGGGYVNVIDTGTPANDLTDEPFATSNIVNSSTSAKYVLDSARVLTLTSAGDIPQSYDLVNSRYGILVEPAATNLILRSQEFDDASWISSNQTETADQIAAPDGTTTADLITLTGDDVIRQDVTISAGATVTASVYFKAGTTTQWICLGLGSGTGNRVDIWFDIINGVVGTNGTAGSGWAHSASSIETLASGWYRCIATVTTAVNTTFRFAWDTRTADGGSTGGSSGWTYYVWGAQVEATAYGTSYIPTTTVAVTRAVDDITVATSTIPFQQNPGTMYADYSARSVSGTKTVASFTDGTDDNDEVSLRYANADPTLVIDAGGVNQTSTDLGTAVAGTRHQMTASWDTNDVDGSFDGAAPTNDATATMPTGMDELGLGDRPALDTPLNGHIYRFVYVPRHVENDDGDVENWRYNF